LWQWQPCHPDHMCHGLCPAHQGNEISPHEWCHNTTREISFEVRACIGPFSCSSKCRLNEANSMRWHWQQVQRVNHHPLSSHANISVCEAVGCCLADSFNNLLSHPLNGLYIGTALENHDVRHVQQTQDAFDQSRFPFHIGLNITRLTLVLL
jgi:hypothetical protein